MLSDRDIIRIANDAYNEFMVNFLVDCQFEVVSLNKFVTLAEKNNIISIVDKSRNVKNINFPVITLSGEKFKIFYCSNVIAKIIKGFSKEKQKMFIGAITLHELYHIVNRVEKRDLTVFSFLRSEKKAFLEFKEDYPSLVRILYEVKKRFKIRK